jgi:hypothetical protein
MALIPWQNGRPGEEALHIKSMPGGRQGYSHAGVELFIKHKRIGTREVKVFLKRKGENHVRLANLSILNSSGMQTWCA